MPTCPRWSSRRVPATADVGAEQVRQVSGTGLHSPMGQKGCSARQVVGRALQIHLITRHALQFVWLSGAGSTKTTRSSWTKLVQGRQGPSWFLGVPPPYLAALERLALLQESDGVGTCVSCARCQVVPEPGCGWSPCTLRLHSAWPRCVLSPRVRLYVRSGLHLAISRATSPRPPSSVRLPARAGGSGQGGRCRRSFCRCPGRGRLTPWGGRADVVARRW